MKVLAIDSSGLTASVCLMNEEKLIVEYTINHRKTHSQTLLPAVNRILEDTDISCNDIDVFAVSSGPGSFTGLRIGICTIKGLAYGRGDVVAVIPTLDGLAHNLINTKGIICPIMDARRDQVYTAVYRSDGSKLECIVDYCAMYINELLELLNKYDEKILFNGDGVAVYWDRIEDQLGNNAIKSPLFLMLQTSSSIASLAIKVAQQSKLINEKQLKPFYLRKSQAEQRLSSRRK